MSEVPPAAARLGLPVRDRLADVVRTGSKRLLAPRSCPSPARTPLLAIRVSKLERRVVSTTSCNLRCVSCRSCAFSDPPDVITTERQVATTMTAAGGCEGRAMPPLRASSSIGISIAGLERLKPTAKCEPSHAPFRARPAGPRNRRRRACRLVKGRSSDPFPTLLQANGRDRRRRGRARHRSAPSRPPLSAEGLASRRAAVAHQFGGGSPGPPPQTPSRSSSVNSSQPSLKSGRTINASSSGLRSMKRIW